MQTSVLLLLLLAMALVASSHTVYVRSKRVIVDSKTPAQAKTIIIENGKIVQLAPYEQFSTIEIDNKGNFETDATAK